MSTSAAPHVVTVVSGRHEHLAVQRHHLARCELRPTEHVVVASEPLADATLRRLCDELGVRFAAYPRAPEARP